MTPEIAIVDSNTLSCLGLQNLLEEIIPTAVIRSFRSFGELMDDTPDMYVHYFISSQIYFEHTAFFLERKPKTIVLVNGETVPQLSSVPTLNIYQDEQNLAKNILQLRQYGDQYHLHQGRPESAGHANMAPDTTSHDLSAQRNRSAGADYQRPHQQGDCRQTEHQPDHHHLTPQEYHREAGHQVRIRADYLCSHARICGSRQNIILQPEHIRSGVFQKGAALISVLVCQSLIVPS